MATRKSPTPASAASDRYATLRRAHLAFESLDQLEVTPPALKADEAAQPATGIASPLGGSAPSATSNSTAPPGFPGLVHSQPGRPLPQSIVRAVTPTAGMRITPAGSAFERLKLGQERLVRSNGPAPTEGDPAKTVALGRDAFDDIKRQARLHHTLALLTTVSAYFKCTPDELHAEQDRLGKMNSVQLDAVTRAYDHAAKQVLVTTNEVHSQKAAREASLEIKQFYEQNGTTELLIDSGHPRPGARSHP